MADSESLTSNASTSPLLDPRLEETGSVVEISSDHTSSDVPADGENFPPTNQGEIPDVSEGKSSSAESDLPPLNLWTTNQEVIRVKQIEKVNRIQRYDWPRNWEFLVDEYKSLYKGMAVFKKNKDLIQKEIDKLKNIPCPESNNEEKTHCPSVPLPKTSSGMIGWKSSREYIKAQYPDYLWERNYKVQFEKQLGWPSDPYP
ncbi:hypothetical protein Ahia01_000407400 [Argonauta hians]